MALSPANQPISQTNTPTQPLGQRLRSCFLVLLPNASDQGTCQELLKREGVRFGVQGAECPFQRGAEENARLGRPGG